MPRPALPFTLAAFALFLGSKGFAQPVRETPPSPYPSALAHKPTPLPDRVVLTWNGDPATTQAVTWRTDTTVTKAVAELAVAEGGPAFAAYGSKKVRSFPAATTPFTADLGECHYHTVTFDQLKPRTKYVYRVGDGLNWSEWFQFETPSDKPAPLRFIYLGDAQTEIKQHWSRVVRGAYSDMPKAQFLLHAGDLVNNGLSDAEWGEWFAAAGWINGTVPCVPSPGNHEYTAPGGMPPGIILPSSRLAPHWRKQFTLPENGPPGLEETAYYFDIQGVRVVSLNSNERQAEQVEWLDKVLTENPNRWTVLTFHHPLYATVAARDNARLRELWRPIIDKHGVDLVMQGHDHSYGRSGLMREDNLLRGATVHDKGTVYAVSVSGPKLYTIKHEPWMAASLKDTQLYQLVTIDGDRLHYEARTATGVLADEFELHKPASGGNVLVERNEIGTTEKRDPTAGRSEAIAALAGMAGLAGVYALVRMMRRRAAAR